MGLPHSYLEQQTGVDNPLLEVNWIGFFNHSTIDSDRCVTVTLFEERRGKTKKERTE